MIGLILYAIAIYIIGGVAASITYHRMLTHRSIEVIPWFRKLLIILSLPAGTPIQWVGTHRQHHRYTDKLGDPHSPHIHGFWYAHCGWYIGQKNSLVCFIYAIAGPVRMWIDSWWRPRTNQHYNHLAKDIQKDPFCKSISQPLVYTCIMHMYLLILVGFSYYLWGAVGIGVTWLMLVLVYNIGDGVNSFGHLFGTNTHLHSEAKNNRILRYIAFGEGAHSYHHKHPHHTEIKDTDDSIDLGYLCIIFLKRIGLVLKTN